MAIPRALITWQCCRSFRLSELGFNVVISGKTTKRRSGRALRRFRQPCFPVKAAFGHVKELLDAQPDYLFIPSITSMTPTADIQKHTKLCPYVQSFAFQVQSAAGRATRTNKILSGPLYGATAKSRCRPRSASWPHRSAPMSNGRTQPCKRHWRHWRRLAATSAKGTGDSGLRETE